MLNKRSLRQFMPLLLISLTLFSSCEDKTGTLGLDVLPSDDLFEGIDTISPLVASNINPEKLRSDDPDFAIIGTVNDEFAGKTSASFLTQVNMGGYIEKFNKSEDYFVDSLVLNLAYGINYWFGDRFAQHNVEVFRLTEPLSPSSSYYSDMEIDGMYDPEPLAQRISSGWDQVADTVWQQEEDYVHQWKFKLDDELAREVFNYSEETLDSREAFQEMFAGLLVKSQPVDAQSEGSLITLDLIASQSNMQLFYSYHERDSATNAIDTTKQTSYTFPINRECVRVNLFEHQHDGVVEFNNPDASNLVAQGMAGSYIEIDFENSIEFDKWEERLASDSDLDDFYGISAVDIFFKADTTKQNNDTSAVFYSPIPASLSIYQMDEEGSLNEPVYETGNESSPTGRWFVGGTYNKETAEYQFRMAGEYFRMMVANSDLRGPYYLASPSQIADNRRIVFVNDPNSEEPTPKIRIKHVIMDKP